MNVRAAELIAEQAEVDDSFTLHNSLPGSLDNVDDSRKEAVDTRPAVQSHVFIPSIGAVEQMFLFAMVWGLGGGLTGDSALAFDVYVRDLLQVSHLRRRLNPSCRCELGHWMRDRCRRTYDECACVIPKSTRLKPLLRPESASHIKIVHRGKCKRPPGMLGFSPHQ